MVRKPSINTFLEPIYKELAFLFHHGIQSNLLDSLLALTCKAIVLSGTCDVPAKSTVLNMTGHNGFLACPYCEQPGESLSVGNAHVHVYPYASSSHDGPARTHSAIKKCAEEVS